MMTDIERMKAELEANDYIIGETNETYTNGLGHVYATKTSYISKIPFYITGKLEYIIPKAYDHLQEQRKLKALEAFVIQLGNASKEVESLSGETTNPLDVAVSELFRVANRAFAYIEKYNITADDESDDNEPI